MTSHTCRHTAHSRYKLFSPSHTTLNFDTFFFLLRFEISMAATCVHQSLRAVRMAMKMLMMSRYNEMAAVTYSS